MPAASSSAPWLIYVVDWLPPEFGAVGQYDLVFAREMASAEHVAELRADVITVAYGTNCWVRTPHSVGAMREGIAAFLEMARTKHPETPIVVTSPIVRPDAEGAPNPLGATLEHLREALEESVRERIAAGDLELELLPGRHLVHESQLGDGIHPNDDGHRAMADGIGVVVAARLGA